jgi:O-antigen/teichoic acid export membrane protein
MSGEDTHELDLGREALVSFASNAAMMAFGFAGVVLFARVLGPAGLGAYYLVLAGGRSVSQLSNGVGSAVKKRVSEAGTDPSAFFGVGLLAHLGVALVVGVAGLLAEPLLARVIDVPNLVVSITAIVFSLGLFQVCNALYAGIGNPASASWADTARSVLTLLFQVGFVLLGWGPFGLIVGFAAASFVSGVGVWVASGVIPRLPSRSTVRSTGEFARWSVPNSLVSDLYGRIDVIIVGVVAGNAAVGFYETALRLVQPGAFFATSISGPLLVKVSGLSSRGRDVVPDLKNALSYAGLLAVPIFFGALAMPVEIMRTVFGPEFAAAWPALIGLAFFQVVSAYAAPLRSAVTGSDEIRIEFGVSGGILLLHVPLAVLLGSRYGLAGVVGATMIAETVRFAVYQLFSKRLFEQAIVPRPIGAQVVTGGAMAAVVYLAVQTVFPVRGWPWLLVAVSFGAAVYFAALSVLSEHFRLTLENVLPVPDPYSR